MIKISLNFKHNKWFFIYFFTFLTLLYKQEMIQNNFKFLYHYKNIKPQVRARLASAQFIVQRSQNIIIKIEKESILCNSQLIHLTNLPWCAPTFIHKWEIFFHACHCEASRDYTTFNLLIGKYYHMQLCIAHFYFYYQQKD